ncbi:hypothetical protein GcM3_201030 [Golovinomyces cichoracearum]|uniref:Cyclin-dependent kinase n=1 Tax=Golovinomyces cichoracearum TaxID=62708 RepID=A0A420HDD6_9PEZI|nr:hypothetical protein GcM3_201030 [Golovinomyces cichoracearum]
MEPHELAIAALDQVARNSSSCNRAESGRTSNEGLNSSAGVHSSALVNSGNDVLMQRGGKEQESQGSSRIDLKITGSNPPSTDKESRLSTPPSSNSDTISSQNVKSQGPQSHLSQLSNVAAAQEPLNNALATPLTAGQKRTADGHVKSESPNYSASISKTQHSRKISTVSNGSPANSTRIEELTSELRTRLSYAMVKVNNGWQSNSIDEVESLASHRGSPSSSSSILQGRRHLHSSPRVAMAKIKGKKNGGPNMAQSNSPDFDICCRLDQSSRTYESFWRDHSVTDPLNHQNSPNRQARSSPASRALAPPAEICSSYPRSYDNLKNNSKKVYIRPGYNSHSPSSVSAPQTPQRIGSQRLGNTINPPSQTTTQEQDAIETLLFMSSPGNLNNMGHILPPPKLQTSPQRSPLRAELYMMPTKAAALERSERSKIGFHACEKLNGDWNCDNQKQPRPSSKKPNKTPSQENLCRNVAIERLLDEMGDSSSDEDEIVLKNANSTTDSRLTNNSASSSTSHHRATVGRV